ncbi:sulfatase-like hydrolase/transferase [Candidatus Poribacteria bacterium]|nr:sulfatase-like hydrolase/transferase [Candidatus Poribacteria bacterium]
MSVETPNILWICTDQQRYDTIGALGNPYVSTPNIDSLVAEGVAFTHAYCQSPICTPSRASFLTGMYPSAVHVNGNGNDYFPNTFPLVTRTLADIGYDCGLIGKLHLASAFRRIEPRVDDGYRYWQYSHAPRDDWKEGHDYADWVRSNGYVLGELTQNPEGVPAELHQTTWCAEKTIEFIREERDGPWLASVNIYDPHPPFNPPQTYREQFNPADMPEPLFKESDLEQQNRLSKIDFQSKVRTPDELDIRNPILPQSPRNTTKPELVGKRDTKTLKAAYYAMIKLIDDQLGRILEALDETGQRDNTVIIFTSDHGEMLGDHGLIQKGCRFYEGLVRVPLIFSWKGNFESGLISDALVELVDKTPTLLELVGLTVPEGIHGSSLLPILRGEADANHHREFVRCEYYDALDQRDHSYATMYRDKRYKLVVYHGHEEGELYDLVDDPDEFNNLWYATDKQDIKFDLMKRSFDSSMLAMDKGPKRVGPM